jgi:hypothetical protein
MLSYHPKSEGARSGAIFTSGFRYVSGIHLSRAANAIARFAWSPACFKDGYRAEKNFQMAEAVALDFDSGELSLADAVNNFCDMQHIIGTTRSHQISKGGGPPVDRFRVVLRLEEPLTNLADYRETLRCLLYRYPADPAAKDGARFFFPCKEIVSVSDDGYLEPIKRADPEKLKKRVETMRAAGVVSGGTIWALNNVVPIGERNTAFFRVAKDLLRFGRTEDETFEAIIGSETYKKTPVTDDLVRELLAVVRSAVRSLARESETITGQRGN